MTRISFSQAINDAQRQAMELDDGVFVYGIGADGKTGIFGTTTGLVETFGRQRVFDTPIAEQALTALAAGAASSGLRPVLVHQRMDFMLYSVDHIVNWIASWRFASGGVGKMPLTIRTIVGKGWGQGPQHSKSLHTWFAHVPGLKVVVPGSPADAKGLLIASILNDDPTLFIEARSLYSMTEEVPDQPYAIRLGQALIRRPGSDVSIVTFGAMVPMALEAADILAQSGIHAEIVDLRTIAPLDVTSILESVARTRRLVVAEAGWLKFGVSSEVIAVVCENLGNILAAPPRRVGWPQAFAPTSAPLEAAFYPKVEALVEACRATLASEANVVQCPI